MSIKNSWALIFAISRFWVNKSKTFDKSVTAPASLSWSIFFFPIFYLITYLINDSNYKICNKRKKILKVKCFNTEFLLAFLKECYWSIIFNFCAVSFLKIGFIFLLYDFSSFDQLPKNTIWSVSFAYIYKFKDSVEDFCVCIGHIYLCNCHYMAPLVLICYLLCHHIFRYLQNQSKYSFFLGKKGTESDYFRNF